MNDDLVNPNTKGAISARFPEQAPGPEQAPAPEDASGPSRFGDLVVPPDNLLLSLSPHDSEGWAPSSISDVISWQGHIPFAFMLIRTMRPRVLVELGTHKGDSYLAFCEAVARFSTNTLCFAVDTWAGDDHSGLYGEEVLSELREKHDAPYGAFSTLMQSTFDEALAAVEDGSVDLLHIDGLHTYEAVKHDFTTWKGKLSDRGIVLFHDIAVQAPGFGVARFWDEIKPLYPHFEFRHSNGLGVIAISDKAAARLQDLFGTSGATAVNIARLYQVLGDSISFQGLTKRHENEIRRLETLVLAEREAATAEITRLNQTIDVVQSALDRIHNTLPFRLYRAVRKISRLP